MTSKMMNFVLKFRSVLYAIAIIVFLLGFLSKAQAFWPPDLIPHPDVPEPKNINDDRLADYGPKER